MSTNGYTATYDDTPSMALTPRDRLLERLNDPRTVDALNTLLDKADVIAFSVQALDGLLRRGDEVIESLSASVADLKQLAPNGDAATLVSKLPKLAKTGVQLAEATETPAFNNLVNSGLLERLGDPKTIEALKTLLDKMEVISFSVVMIDGFVHRINEVMDAIATSVSELRAVAPDAAGGSIVNMVSTTLPQLTQAGRAFSQSGIVDKIPELSKAGVDLANSGMLDKFDELTRTLVQLVESGIFSEKTVSVLADAGKTLADTFEETQSSQPKAVGMMGMVKALNDPDIQRAVGFFLDFAKRYGAKMK